MSGRRHLIWVTVNKVDLQVGYIFLGVANRPIPSFINVTLTLAYGICTGKSWISVVE